MRIFLWNLRRQELPMKLILVSGLTCSVYCMIRRWTLFSLILIVITMTASWLYVLISQRKNKEQFGKVYYRMPDSEIVEEQIDSIWDEIKKDNKCRIEGREVSVQCVYTGQSPWGTIDTGYGIEIVIDEKTEMLLEKIKRGEIISITGRLTVTNIKELKLIDVSRIARN